MRRHLHYLILDTLQHRLAQVPEQLLRRRRVREVLARLAGRHKEERGKHVLREEPSHAWCRGRA